MRSAGGFACRPRAIALAAAISVVLAAGCASDKDGGLTDPELPALTKLVPVRTVVGDTVRIEGIGFGTDPAGRTIQFGGTGFSRAAVEAVVVSWGDDEIVVLVPEGAAAGNVRMEDEGRFSQGLAFDVAPEVVSFEHLLETLFVPQGCESCHFGSSGNNGFSVLTPDDIREGGQNGPAAIPRRAAESLIVLKVTNPPFGDRMPQGSPPISASQLLLLSDWINQGMRDN